jgi:protocatechuate 3,4-dioxygenase beta subunit
MSATIWLLSAVAIGSLQAGAQTPARDPRMDVRATAAITGIVVADDQEARPVRHARVILIGDAIDGLTTVTDDRGRFAFANLPPGRFTATASKDGWVATTYGSKKPLHPGTAVLVNAGQRSDIRIRLAHGAVIAGTLVDPSGQPSIGTTVRAIRYVLRNGERRAASLRASAVTDDRGEYRIYGLAPGDYLVGASWRPAFLGAQGQELRLTTDVDVRDARGATPAAEVPQQTVALASTFYPGTTAPAQATVLTLAKGEERDGVDMALQIVPTSHVDGTIVLPSSSTVPSGMKVSLMATGQVAFPGLPFDGYRTATISPDGSFAFADVLPGRYTVLARTTVPAEPGTPAGQPPILWASADISVDGDTVSGLVLALAPGMTIAGQVQFDGTSLTPPSDKSAVRVALQPVLSGEAVSVAPAGAKVDANGQFVLTGVTPGKYRLSAAFPGSGKPDSWNVRSALVGIVDAFDTPFDVQPNQNIGNAVITFSDHVSQLAGRLQNPAGAAAPDYSVVIFPADQSLWTAESRRIQSVRPSAEGAFRFGNLPPGDYRLAAVDDIEPGQWDDPAILQQLLSMSIPLSIADGERKLQNVRVGR